MKYKPGELVYVAGEMLVSKTTPSGKWKMVMFAEGQLGLTVHVGNDSILVWFAEFGINKKEEHIFACAPLHKQTTRIWSVNSARAASGAEDFLNC